MKTTKHNITNTAEPIKPGYKKTPVGIIPEDWEVKELGNLCEDICGEYGANKSAIPYSTDLPRYVRITDINDEGNLHFDSKASANLSLEEEKKFKLEHHDLLFARTGATVGKSYLHRNETDEKFVYAGFLIRFRLCPNKVNPIFIKGYTDTSKYWHWVKTYSARSGQPGLNSNEYKSLKLPIPPLPEQKAIADCLSTWDKGIEKLSALIAFKKEQKKGLMQGLFSGKLKVENGELVKVEDEKLWLKGWKEVLLKTISTVTKGKQLNRSELNEADKYPSYSGGITPSGYTDKYNCDANTIIISEGGNSCGYVNFIDVDFWLGGHCYSVENNAKKMNKNFLYNILKYNEPKIMRLRVGSGLPNVQKGDLEKFKLKVPSLKEQTEIAEVFNAANKEIELLEKKLETFKTQKKGLMQVLLTGTKRLVEN